jgi:hypothetical protein
VSSQLGRWSLAPGLGQVQIGEIEHQRIRGPTRREHCQNSLGPDLAQRPLQIGPDVHAVERTQEPHRTREGAQGGEHGECAPHALEFERRQRQIGVHRDQLASGVDPDPTFRRAHRTGHIVMGDSAGEGHVAPGTVQGTLTRGASLENHRGHRQPDGRQVQIHGIDLDLVEHHSFGPADTDRSAQHHAVRRLACDPVVEEGPVHSHVHIREIAVGLEPARDPAPEGQRVQEGTDHFQIEILERQIQSPESQTTELVGERDQPTGNTLRGVAHVELANVVLGQEPAPRLGPEAALPCQIGKIGRHEAEIRQRHSGSVETEIEQERVLGPRHQSARVALRTGQRDSIELEPECVPGLADLAGQSTQLEQGVVQQEREGIDLRQYRLPVRCRELKSIEVSLETLHRANLLQPLRTALFNPFSPGIPLIVQR